MVWMGILYVLAVAAFVAAVAFFGMGVSNSWSDPGFAPHRSRLIWNYPAAIRHAPGRAQVHFRRFYAAMAAFIALCCAGALSAVAMSR